MKTTSTNKRVLVALSGGVDSSVSALLLQKQGYDVVGMTMQVWDYSRSESDMQSGHGSCCSSVDVEDARAVCQKLNIPFYVLNCSTRFQEKVIDKFVNSYLKGETPIPCVDCNTYLKFDLLIQKMQELECHYLATGHYATVKKTKNGYYHVLQSADDLKDQTYFLFTLSPNVLSKILFPVGNMSKKQVRQIALQHGLNVAHKKDSTGLCFIGSKGYAPFIQKQVDHKSQKGPIKLYPSGEVIGSHNGLYHFTYGQRKGLGVSSNKPLYVLKTEPKTNTLYVGSESYLYSAEAKIKNLNWLDKVSEGERLRVKIRSHHTGCFTRIYQKKHSAVLEFEEPQKAITPGQSAVLYRDRQLVGGGVFM